jgi:aspartate oxidase
VKESDHRHRRLLRARAASGHAIAAPLSSVMKSRRPMQGVI